MTAPDLQTQMRIASATAARRRERIVGYYGGLDGYFRFEFAAVERVRKRSERPSSPPANAVTRGVLVERPQGSLF